MAADLVRVNGNLFSFASTFLKIDGVPFYGYKGVKWNEKRERVKGYGAGKHRTPRGRTAGKYSAECTLTLARDSYTTLTANLAAKAPDSVSYGNVEFPMVFQYVEDTSNQAPVTVEFETCVVSAGDHKSEEGDDPDVVDVTIDVMRIKTNGLTLYDAQSLNPT